MRSLKITIFLIIYYLSSYAQTSPIGSWRTYMPYQQTVEVLKSNNKLYGICYSGIFTLNLQDSTFDIITKIDGLSEVKIKTASIDKGSGAIIIAYENTKLDIIKSNEIINIDDIFNKEITGLKSINSIDCINGIAYINCGFGTVLYDFNKNEIKDTYYLGTNGASLAVYNIALLGNKIYAATDSGILEADANNPNLSNYQNWTKHTPIQNYPSGKPTIALVEFNNKLFAKYGDSINSYSGGTWQKATQLYQGNIKKFKVDNNHLIAIEPGAVITYDQNLIQQYVYFTPNFQGTISSAIYDNSGVLWLSDYIKGLVSYSGNSILGNYYPNGPYQPMARRLAINKDKLIVASGNVGDNYTNKYNRNGIYKLEGGVWQNRNFINYSPVDSFYDFCVVGIDPISGREYYGSFWKGLVEMNNGEYIRNYSYHNSTIGEAVGNKDQYRITGIAFDSKNQLWVSNYWANKPISVRRSNGQWKAFEFPGIFQEFKYVSDLTIDRNDNKWVCIPRSNAILVFNEDANGVLKYKRLQSGEGLGNLPKDATEVLCITEDKEGRIWAGTNKGLVVFYNASTILTGDNIDGQPVKVIDGEFVQSLLENETINCIKVDGGNRKWIGTTNGVWLFSDDGTKQIHFFNKNNSPLLSNHINDIAISPTTGEVYFATDDGIISYRSDATEGTDKNQELVKVFPNPVKDTYTGPIAIDGLVQNANIKVTDINGKIVFHTKANGAQAIWYGKNFQGERVSTGVYLVFSTDEEGEEKMVNKILFIH